MNDDEQRPIRLSRMMKTGAAPKRPRTIPPLRQNPQFPDSKLQLLEAGLTHWKQTTGPVSNCKFSRASLFSCSRDGSGTVSARPEFRPDFYSTHWRLETLVTSSKHTIGHVSNRHRSGGLVLPFQTPDKSCAAGTRASRYRCAAANPV